MNEVELLNELRELFPKRHDLHALAQRSDRNSRKELSVTMSHCMRQSIATLRQHLHEDSSMMKVILVSLRHRIGVSMQFRDLVDAISAFHVWNPTSRVREHSEAIPEVIAELRALALVHPVSTVQIDLFCFVLRIVRVAEKATLRHYSIPPSQLA
jgi:hypothetical protein